MRFNQSLRGLTVNAAVDFLGVNIGKVVSVDLDYDPATKTFPGIVGAVIYPKRLGAAESSSRNSAARAMKKNNLPAYWVPLWPMVCARRCVTATC